LNNGKIYFPATDCHSQTALGSKSFVPLSFKRFTFGLSKERDSIHIEYTIFYIFMSTNMLGNGKSRFKSLKAVSLNANVY
jgi:hypothetical protein